MATRKSRGGFRIEEIAVTSASLRAGAPPLRFAHLTDLHLRVLRPRHERLADAINERRPDFVFLTGDLNSNRSDTWQMLSRLVSKFECRHGVFACRGNWELRCALRLSTLREMMADCGARLLVNESCVVQTASGKVRISGVDDLGTGWPDFRAALRDGREADYGILLSHAPLAARFISEEMGIHLVLSGHTHGGQIRIPLLWRLTLPSCHGGFAGGLYRQPWGHLYVNRGFGGVGLIPLRFRCPAEVAFFEVSGA